MKINILTKTSIVTMALLCNSVLTYGATVVTSTNINTVKQNNISVISSKNGENISTVDSLNSIFKISFTDNNYITTKFAVVTSSDDYVPVYSSPSNKSSTIGSIPTNSTVVLGKQEGDFFQIFFDEEIGYIENIYLKNSKPKESPSKNSQPTQNNKENKYVLITSTSGLNLREAPSVSSQVLLTIPSGAYADLIEYDDNWLKVEYNNKIGYISSQFGQVTDKKEEDKQEVPPSNKANRTELVNFAMSHLGKPYIYGSTNLNVGTDCSGFTYAIFKHFGITLNRVSKDQYLNGVPVNNKKDLLPGDLVFFNTGGDSKISHVGIYIGNNQYIHSTDSKNQGVIISSLNSDYSLKTYYGARRVL